MCKSSKKLPSSPSGFLLRFCPPKNEGPRGERIDQHSLIRKHTQIETPPPYSSLASFQGWCLPAVKPVAKGSKEAGGLQFDFAREASFEGLLHLFGGLVPFFWAFLHRFLEDLTEPLRQLW